MTRTPQELVEAAQQVLYEVLSMVDMAVRLNRHGGDAVIDNALLEGTLLHCRNVIDFLGPWIDSKKGKKDDDIRPSDFVAGWDTTLLQVTDAERTSIHKHLAHLTWTRVDEGKQQWEFPGIVGATFEAWGLFVEHAEQENCPQAPMFRLNTQLALLGAGLTTSPAETGRYTTTGSADDPLVLHDFTEPTP